MEQELENLEFKKQQAVNELAKSLKQQAKVFVKTWANTLINFNLISKDVIEYCLSNKYVATEQEAREQYNVDKRQSKYYITSKEVPALVFEGDKYIITNSGWNYESRRNGIAEYIYGLIGLRPDAQPIITKGCNIIIYGAPGTGKSYLVAKKMDLDEGRITRVVFHPEYTYFDFVGQYRPCPLYDKMENKLSVLDEENGDKPVPYIDYQFVPGPFTNVLVDAYNDPDNDYTLLIEELNRADAPAVFGDVFQLLDRDADGESEYGITPSTEWGKYLKNAGVDFDGGKIKLPSNMNIIATMNSADQGVHVLDTAFKRRWEYEFMSVDMDASIKKELKINVPYNGQVIYWYCILERINKRLRNIDDIEEDRLIGPFFVKPDQVRKNPQKSLEKILFYLWDDILRNNGRTRFFDDNYKTMKALIDGLQNGEDVLGISDQKSKSTVDDNGVGDDESLSNE